MYTYFSYLDNVPSVCFHPLARQSRRARPPPALQTQRACVAEAKRRAAAVDAAHRAAALPRALTTLLAAAVSACPHRCCRARPCMEQYGVCAQSRCACKPSTNPVCVCVAHRVPSGRLAVGKYCRLGPTLTSKPEGAYGRHMWQATINFESWQPEAVVWVDFGPVL